jgi:hypothetical protein
VVVRAAHRDDHDAAGVVYVMVVVDTDAAVPSPPFDIRYMAWEGAALGRWEVLAALRSALGGPHETVGSLDRYHAQPIHSFHDCDHRNLVYVLVEAVESLTWAERDMP